MIADYVDCNTSVVIGRSDLVGIYMQSEGMQRHANSFQYKT